MTAAHQALAAALRERLAIIGDHAWRARAPAEQLAALGAVSERIVALQAELPAPVHPELAHFLARCSYDKALAWIEEA